MEERYFEPKPSPLMMTEATIFERSGRGRILYLPIYLMGSAQVRLAQSLFPNMVARSSFCWRSNSSSKRADHLGQRSSIQTFVAFVPVSKGVGKPAVVSWAADRTFNISHVGSR